MHQRPHRPDIRHELKGERRIFPGVVLGAEELLRELVAWDRLQHLSHVDAQVWEFLMQFAKFAPVCLETVAPKGVVGFLHRMAPQIQWCMEAAPTHQANFAAPHDLLAFWK